MFDRFSESYDATLATVRITTRTELKAQFPSIVFFFIVGLCSAVLVLYQTGRSDDSSEIRNFVSGVVSTQLLLIFMLICLSVFATAFSVRLIESRLERDDAVSNALLQLGLGGLSSFVLPAIGFFLGLASFELVILVDAALGNCAEGVNRIFKMFTGKLLVCAVLGFAYVGITTVRSVRYKSRTVCLALLVFVLLSLLFFALELVGDVPSKIRFKDAQIVVGDPLAGMDRCKKYGMWRL